jgi:hypothetical protein
MSQHNQPRALTRILERVTSSTPETRRRQFFQAWAAFVPSCEQEDEVDFLMLEGGGQALHGMWRRASCS